MKIIAHLNPLFRPDEFERMLSSHQEISGISFNVTSTKDGKIVVFESQQDASMIISTIQNNTIDQLKTLNIKNLDDFLFYFRQYGKKIILNILPLYYPPITENTVDLIREMNLKYVISINEIVEQYPNLNLYLCSTNQNVVEHMKTKISTKKVGFIVQEDNITFIDTDFYKLPVQMFDLSIIEELLKNNKEIFVIVHDCADTSILLDYFHKYPSINLKKNILRELHYDCNYPEIFYLTFKNLEV